MPSWLGSVKVVSDGARAASSQLSAKRSMDGSRANRNGEAGTIETFTALF